MKVADVAVFDANVTDVGAEGVIAGVYVAFASGNAMLVSAPIRVGEFRWVALPSPSCPFKL